MTGRLAAAWRAVMRPRHDGKLALLAAVDATAAQVLPHELLRLGRSVEVVEACSGDVLVAAHHHGEWHHHVLDGHVVHLAATGTATLLSPGAVCVTTDGDTLTSMTPSRLAVTRADVAAALRPLAPTLLAEPVTPVESVPRQRRVARRALHVDTD